MASFIGKLRRQVHVLERRWKSKAHIEIHHGHSRVAVCSWYRSYYNEVFPHPASFITHHSVGPLSNGGK